jgi:hypothetical protein
MSIQGITINDAIMNMPKGWVVVYEDGTTITENEADWYKIKKKGIKILALKWNNKWWSVRGKTAYIQFKRGTAFFAPAGGINSDVICTERCIGYYDENGNKVIYRVNEQTGEMRLDVQEPKK